MEEITDYRVKYEQLKKEYDSVLEKLQESRDQINDLREEMDKISHEDEIIITTKHTIRNLEVYFE